LADATATNLDARREAALARITELELPSFRGAAGWEFTPIDKLDLDAYPVAPGGTAPSSFGLDEAPPEGAIVMALAQAAEEHAELVERHLGSIVDGNTALVARNDAHWTDGTFVYVPRGVTVEAPIADAAARERLHRPWPPEGVDRDERVEHRQRRDPVGHRCGELEPDRPADVVDDDVKAREPERVDRGHAEAPQPRPRVIERDGPVGKPKAGQVERDASQAARRELGEQLAVQKTGRRNAVQTHDRVAVACCKTKLAVPEGCQYSVLSCCGEVVLV
jgi:hypothetical protein